MIRFPFWEDRSDGWGEAEGVGGVCALPGTAVPSPSGVV